MRQPAPGYMAPRRVLVTFALVLPALMIPLNLWFARSEIWQPVFDASAGLVHPTLLAGLVLTLIAIVGVVLGLGRAPARAIGLEPEKLPAAIAWTISAWLLLQGVALAGSAIDGQGVGFSNLWTADKWTKTTGQLSAQLFGNALAEELIYRGVLLVQLYLILEPWYPQKKSAFLAILFAALIFAVLHLPNRVMKGNFDTAGDFLVDQTVLVLTGMLFGWAYWRTRNLFALVGFHSLVNEPSMLLTGPDPWPEELWTVLVIVMLAVYAWVCPARTPPMEAASTRADCGYQ